MSRSYQADEKVFQKLLRCKGKTSWDEQADPQANFDKFVMRPFLEESLAAMPRASHKQSALEVGCGSGPICCVLAARGWAVRESTCLKPPWRWRGKTPSSADWMSNLTPPTSATCPSSPIVTIWSSTAIVCTASCMTSIGARR